MPENKDPFDDLEDKEFLDKAAKKYGHQNIDEKPLMDLDQAIDEFRNQKERNNLEYKIHCAIVEHHRTAFPTVQLIHIPNQTRDATEAFFNKKMGIEPGVYDLLLLSTAARADFVEVKAPDGYPSTSQKKFKGRIDHKGFRNGVVKSVRQYHALLVSWGHAAAHNSIREPDLRTSGQKQADMMEMYRPK